MLVWQKVLESKLDTVYQKATSLSTGTGSVTTKGFDFNAAKTEFDAQWKNLIMTTKDKDIFEAANCYICCGRKYFFSKSEFRYFFNNPIKFINEQISIVVDGYEDISNDDFNHVTFSVACELDRKKGIITYYKRDKSVLKEVSVDTQTYDVIIETLMNEAIK